MKGTDLVDLYMEMLDIQKAHEELIMRRQDIQKAHEERIEYFKEFFEAYLKSHPDDNEPDISPKEFREFQPDRYDKLFNSDYFAQNNSLVRLFKNFLQPKNNFTSLFSTPAPESKVNQQPQEPQEPLIANVIARRP